MKEITRVHIASVPYEIEPAAKKAVETYLDTLHQFNIDDEAVADIEARIVELLAEKGISDNGVITATDISAITEQLGDPAEFVTDDAAAAVSVDESRQKRRLFRSSDHAVVGGVLGGIADYFGIDAVWLRLIAVVLMFVSFGTVSLVYIVLWIGIPRVQTVADRLQLRGETVTAMAIQYSLEVDGPVVDRTRTARLVLRVCAAVVAIGCAVLALTVTIAGGIGVFIFDHTGFNDVEYVAFGIMAIVDGALLTLLFGLISYALIVNKMSRNIIIASVVVAALGAVIFGAFIGTGLHLTQQHDAYIKTNTVTRDLAIDGNLSKIKSLKLAKGNGNFDVTYKISNDTPHISITGLKQELDDKNAPTANVDKNGQLTINGDAVYRIFDYTQKLKVTVYGPELESIESANSAHITYTAQDQKKLTVIGNNSSTIELYGVINTLDATIADGSSFNASRASVQHVSQQVRDGAKAVYATIGDIEITSPNACRRDGTSTVSVANVHTSLVVLNKHKLDLRAAAEMKDDCLSIEVRQDQ